MFKNKLNKLKTQFNNFYKNKYGMLITMCWVLLFVCVIIKLFGGNWFDFKTENSNFNKFCNYVDKTKWLKIVIGCIIYLISGYFVISVILNEKIKLKHIAMFYPLMITKAIISWYNNDISYILEMLIIVILPIILTRNWKRVLIFNVIILGLQIITIFIRNMSVGFNDNNTFIVQFFSQIDYYIMLILIYLYNFRKEKN